MITHEILFLWLLPASLRASVLVLVVLGLQLALRRWLPARWHHALWLPVVLVLVAPMLPASRFSLENRFQTKPVAAQAEPLSAVVAPESLVETQTVARAGSWQPDGRQLLFAAWFLGASGVLVVGGVGYRRSLHRIARGTVATGPEITASVARVACQLGLKRLPRIIVSTAVESPAVAGLLRPSLLLPIGFSNGFTAGEARLVLLHELTHLKRHDLPLNWLLCVLQALHWFNPLLWLAFARMRADRETACDAQVLGSDAEDRRADYGHALLKFQHTAASPALGLAFVGIFERAGMRSRIRAIANHRRTHPAWGLAAAVMITALTLTGATRAQEAKADTAPKNTQAQPAADQKDKFGCGKFVSFKEGTLILKGNYESLVWHNVTEKTKVVQWDYAAGKYKPSGTAEVLGKVEPGAWVMVTAGRALIRVGARKDRITGTFVSFKDERLLMLGTALSEAFTKKYGNTLHFNKFAEGVPVYESVDGGDFKLVGIAEKILPTVKEGIIVTVYGEGDDNNTRVELGVQVKK